MLRLSVQSLVPPPGRALALALLLWAHHGSNRVSAVCQEGVFVSK
jgi:hypothetical protein